MVPVLGSIANAIHDAVGTRITSLPITPEKILNALKEKNIKREWRPPGLPFVPRPGCSIIIGITDSVEGLTGRPAAID
jgi:hypothetical protein